MILAHQLLCTLPSENNPMKKFPNHTPLNRKGVEDDEEN